MSKALSGITDKIWISATQQKFTCLKWTIETLEKGVKYVQS